MSDTVNHVDTTSRLARWRIENLSSSYRKSDSFRIGNWNWYLTIGKGVQWFISLSTEVSNFTEENPPFASFIIKVTSFNGIRRCLVHPEVIDKQIKSPQMFTWIFETDLQDKLMIDVEFLDIKTASSNGLHLCSIWDEAITNRQPQPSETVFGRMLSENILTDITINLSDGKSIAADKAILSSRSPVFRNMFSHDFKEKNSSTVHVSDMTFESCQALLHYLYGFIQNEEFLAQRLPLLQAADKYDIPDLKKACEQSLIEDISTENVLELLQYASFYQSLELKNRCMNYLVKFGKIFDINDSFNVFVQSADRELIKELYIEVLGYWKGF